MDITTMTAREIMLYSILLNTGVGLVLGLIPLITGIIKENRKFGLFGLLGSIGGGALLGIYLAIPVAAIFTWLIIRNSKKPGTSATVNQRDS